MRKEAPHPGEDEALLSFCILFSIRFHPLLKTKEGIVQKQQTPEEFLPQGFHVSRRLHLCRFIYDGLVHRVLHDDQSGEKRW